MRIIAFVGSPVEDNDKDVSLKCNVLTHFAKSISNNYLFFWVPKPNISVACQDGKTFEKRESKCRYYQLWGRGKNILLHFY